MSDSRIHLDPAGIVGQASHRFLGLAPFLRLSIAGVPLQPVAQALLEAAGRFDANADLWMNLSTALFSIGLDDVGLNVHGQALQMRRTFELPATQQPAKFRLLVLMAPGDLDTNAPLDCLLEDSCVDLVYRYVTADEVLTPADLPECDAVFVAVSCTVPTIPILELLGPLLDALGKPVLNLPQNVPHTERSIASEILQGAPGLVMPLTYPVPRDFLESLVAGNGALADVAADCRFPIILRPIDSHGGHGLERIDNVEDVAAYLTTENGDAFYLANFIDYSGTDGLFRKYRVALVDGKPYASHMAISSHWMIHYVNAGMYEDAAKRAEEAAFMTHFADFAAHHREALEAIWQRTGLDYVCIDCAQTQEGDLLIFEVDHAMVVHAMDSETLFPHKQIHMRKVQDAFEAMLLNLKSRGAAAAV